MKETRYSGVTIWVRNASKRMPYYMVIRHKEEFEMNAKRILALLAAGSFVALAAGCSLMTSAAGDNPSDNTQLFSDFAEPSAEATRLTSAGGTVDVSDVTEITEIVQTTPEATEEPEETASASNSGVHQMELLNFTDEFMTPGSLDGIDPYNDKVVALTFDDGPHPENTPRLLDILKSNDVNATFFVVGENAASYPDIIKRMHEEGNEIGTHSWDHSSNDLKWSHEEVMDQITRCNDAVQEATGLRTIIDRPPEGAINADVADSIGRAQILWDVDPNDWKKENRDPDIVYDNIINGGEIHDGSIVLSHDIRSTTIDAMDRVIKKLKDEGYKFVTVTQLIQIADLRGKDVTTVFNGAPTAASASSAAGDED